MTYLFHRLHDGEPFFYPVAIELESQVIDHVEANPGTIKVTDLAGTWRSSCGELWSFIDGGPNENRVTYCHHCGGKVSNAAAAARVRCFNCGNDQTVEFSYAKSAPAKEQA